MNISKTERLIVYDNEGNKIVDVEIGIVELATMQDKSKVLTIRQARKK